MQKGNSLATSPWPKYPLTSAVMLARSSLFVLQKFAADRPCQIQRTSTLKEKLLSLTVGNALYASLISSKYTVQTITINKSILRKLNDSFGAMVSLLQVDWNEENSGEENFSCSTSAPHKCKKDSQGKLPHSKQQFKWYRSTQKYQLVFLPTHGKYLYDQHLSL